MELSKFSELDRTTEQSIRTEKALFNKLKELNANPHVGGYTVETQRLNDEIRFNIHVYMNPTENNHFVSIKTVISRNGVVTIF